MAFCSQCGQQLAPGSRFCPGCGIPQQGQGAPDRRPVQTIEKTGKDWKGLQAIGVVVMLVSVGLLISLPGPVGVAVAAVVGVVGIGLYFTARAGGWWHHG